MQQIVSNAIGRFLTEANYNRSYTHVLRLLARGTPRLMPSSMECPTRAALAFRADQAILDEYKALDIDTSEAAGAMFTLREGMISVPDPEMDPPTLALFRVGLFWEDIVATALIREFGPPMLEPNHSWADGIVGREMVLDNGLWRGKVDVTTQDGDELTLWEVKTTKLYGIQRYSPSAGHLLQLWMYTQLYQELYDHTVDHAILVYLPNDIYPKPLSQKYTHHDGVIGELRTFDLADFNTDEMGNELRDLAEMWAVSPGDVPRYHGARQWPCKAGGHSCPIYEECYTQREQHFEEVPF